ncbi:hypothetical protein D9619_012361 [Psilocybe cf. subviscida]|uniref:Uncharacterized protein n=1 Tax=Psilocybe cf. subviscida TaxID=2480587 RepID=A0A8H5ERC9_9AGAR|nr:hypothetical protein D9619_012361 [Psilocybe cf. subviscida]
MARRSAPSAQPAYLSAGRTLEDPNESAFSKFLRTEVYAPEKLPGNISVATAVGLFLGGIVAIRTWGEIIVPA